MARLMTFYQKIRRHIGERPFHIQMMALISLFSLVTFFLADLSFIYLNFPRVRLSPFQILAYGRMNLSVEGKNLPISFYRAFLPLFLSLLCVALSLILFLFYRKLRQKLHSAVLSGASVLLLLTGLFSRLLFVSAIIPVGFLEENGLASSDLYVSQGPLANLLSVALLLGAFVSLFSMIGVRFRMKMLTYPYLLWIVIFTIIPLFLIILSAFFVRDPEGSYRFSVDGFHTLFSDRAVSTSFYGITLHLQEYFSVFLRSLDYAVWTTAGCLLLAYPLGYFLAEKAKRVRNTSSGLLLMFFVLPMWINTLLRTYAWRNFFGQTGILNNVLMELNLISEPILFLKDSILGDFVIKLVLINDFLPFMLLPIYSVLVKLDDSVRHAAMDLGADASQTFRKVVLPLSLPGVISGIQMVFMPSLTFYMIPDIMSEGSVTTIGMTVQGFVLSESLAQQRAGNVLSLLLLLFVLITMGILRNADKDETGGGLAL